MKPGPVELLSFGAGPPSVALLILNAVGLVKPRAEVVVFADTGGEKQGTYDRLGAFEDFASEFDLPWIEVRSPDGPLEDYVREKSVPIPIHTENGLGHRQCTDKWKIRPIEVAMRERFPGRPLITQLALTHDFKDIIRMRPPRVKKNQNRWPLVELGFTRQDCLNLILEHNLPIPPHSACYFCPLQSHQRWSVLASESPGEFDKAVDLDGFLRERAKATGKGPLWLHYRKRPLKVLLSTTQKSMGLGMDGAMCDSGYCMT